MQPYQEASEEILRESKLPGQALQTGVKTAAGLIGGGAILNKISPFLNKFIPPSIATKALSKIDPRFGKFIKSATDNGHTSEEALEFIKEKVSEPEKPKENRSIIQQYSDELDAFIKNHIQQGRQPLEAGAIAQFDPKFKKVIAQMEKDHKIPFSAILESTYGSAQQSQQPQQPIPQQQPQQAQGGNNDQMLMAALEKILQM